MEVLRVQSNGCVFVKRNLLGIAPVYSISKQVSDSNHRSEGIMVNIYIIIELS